MPGTVKSELLPDADRLHKCDGQEKVCEIQHLPLDKSHFITVVTNDDDNYPATYKSFTTSAQAAACTTFDTDADALANNMDGTLSYQLIDVSLMENKQVIVIGFTPQGEGGETVYTAFVVEK